MIRDRNIICIASNWFYDPTSKHHVMRILSRDNHVVWVNYHGSRRPTMAAADLRAAAGKIRQFVQGPRRVSENMTVLTPLVVPLPSSRTAVSVNRRLLVGQIRHVLRSLPSRPVQLWSFAPDVDFLCGQFDEECVVYYCVDAFEAFTGYDRAAVLAAERRLGERADLVVTTSETLFEAKRGLNPNTVLVPHGVDVSHFARALDAETIVPADIADLPRPRLGFWGLIQDWLDVELLADVAKARPEWTIVLIGEAATDVGCLRGLANIHMLGRRPYESLPAYAKGFDVGLIPFRVNELTRAVNPIKLREYLAAGLPVVSTALPEVARYADWVEIASDVNGMVAGCERALKCRNDAAMRRRSVEGESWESRVHEICECLPANRQPATTGLY